MNDIISPWGTNELNPDRSANGTMRKSLGDSFKLINLGAAFGGVCRSGDVSDVITERRTEI